MSGRIAFVVPIKPIAQPRPRTDDRGPKARVISAEAKHPVNQYKGTVALYARQAMKNRKPFSGPIAVRLCLVTPRPKRLIWKTKPMPSQWDTRKPDLDNLEKSVFDALNGICWNDDAQVCKVVKWKRIAKGGEKTHASIWVAQLQREQRLLIRGSHEA